MSPQRRAGARKNTMDMTACGRVVWTGISGVYLVITCCFRGDKKEKGDKGDFDMVSVVEVEETVGMESEEDTTTIHPTPWSPSPPISSSPRPWTRSFAPRPTSWLAGPKTSSMARPAFESSNSLVHSSIPHTPAMPATTATTTASQGDSDGVTEPANPEEPRTIRPRPGFLNLRRAAEDFANIAIPHRRLLHENSESEEEASRMWILEHPNRYHHTPAVVITVPHDEPPEELRSLQAHMSRREQLRDENGEFRTGLPVQRRLRSRYRWSEDGRVIAVLPDFYKDESRGAIKRTLKPETPKVKPTGAGDNEDAFSFLWLGDALLDEEGEVESMPSDQESLDMHADLAVAPADILGRPAQLDVEIFGICGEDGQEGEMESIATRMGL
ncbi:hypothetical protein CKM354_000024100 [Cercospora kikuchii]|uniref:Uncharacterized protein n=1 Tax=Cercospora kikuchii TaxID=84275 RepID=A0A9P3C3I6_9PEZI|nr:uncharacterized protein CKM354_000024100 [Cercospora kikuchii]GIZ36774.1 hypothetical protein CKM354_000024100 [Cercospora kikuchii]